ncbi:hypothetical protein IU474_19820 [Nocardia otitidiscaviarum]|uniref:Rv1733c family protein n=1 Tax=Nocardia otitidiscaviarum TaxID=1823 RepID=UPI001892E220|nr:hypothetical protein [Nocardia otitidiscaviarum]MBF6239298.1 hypothetical protein [Nocardia otitidiscaviarum]
MSATPWKKVVQVSANLPVRLWRVQPWNPNPLMRASDRWEALIWLVAVLAALVAVPLAGAIGTTAYTGAAARIAAEDAGKTRVTATVVGMPDDVTGAGGGVRVERFPATVRWDADGRTGEADVNLSTPAVAGADAEVWLGVDGTPTAPPAKPGSAAAEGVGTGLAILVETWCAAAALVWVTHAALTARRNARWDQEWRTMNHSIGRDTL